MLFIFLCLLFLADSCKSPSQEPRITEADSILLKAIQEYDTALNRYDSNFVIGMSKDVRFDTTVVCIYPVYFLSNIPSYQLKFLYLGYKRPIFSDFLFIQTADQAVIKNTLKKHFPHEYYPDILDNPHISYDIIDGDLMYLNFYNNKLIRKYRSISF